MIGALAGVLAIAVVSYLVMRKRRGTTKTSSPTEVGDEQMDMNPMWKPDAKDKPNPYELHSEAVRREQELHEETAGRPGLNGSPHFLHELEGQWS